MRGDQALGERVERGEKLTKRKKGRGGHSAAGRIGTASETAHEWPPQRAGAHGVAPSRPQSHRQPWDSLPGREPRGTLHPIGVDTVVASEL
jgi:hypothetical protein